MPRTIAIGDIHGCAAAFSALIEAVDLQPDDTLVTLGDYIDRGPDSRAVVEQMLTVRERCQLVPLLGNHEIILRSLRERVDALEFWLNGCGGIATLASYGGRLELIPAAHWDFFAALRPFHETTTHLFLHANYLADVAPAELPEEILYWTHLTKVPAPHCSGKQVIVGHTPQLSGEILHAGHVVCIDTWCFGRGVLTAYDVDSGAIWQADKGGEVLRRPT